jgi:hypothetical protein
MPSHVQSKAHQDDANGTTEAVTFDSNVTAGNLIFCTFTMDGAGTTGIDSLTDSLGNTYTQIALIKDTTAGQVYGFYYAKNILGGACTVTVDYTTTESLSFRRIAVVEYSGCDTTAPFDQSGNTPHDVTATGTDGVVSPSITPTANGCLIVGAFGNSSGGNPTIAAGTNFTEDVETATTTGADIEVESLTQGTAAAISATWTVSIASQNCTEFVASFKAAAGAPPPSRPKTIIRPFR